MRVGHAQSLHALHACAYYCSNTETRLVSGIQKRMLEDMAYSKESYIVLSNLRAVVGSNNLPSQVALAQIHRHMHNCSA